MSKHSDTPMPLGDHLEELRRRLILALMGILPVFVLGLVFGRTLLLIIVQPLENALRAENVPSGGMLTTSVLEGFMNYLKIAALLAVIVGGPWILFQAWRFVAPGLYAKEKRFIFLLAPMSVLLSAAGLAFMYYLMLPFALFFFVKFNEGLLQRPPTPIVALPEGVTLPSIPVLAGDPPDPKPGQFWLNTERGGLRITVPGHTAAHSPLPFVSTFSSLSRRLGLTGAPEKDAAPPPPTVLNIPLHSDSLIAQQYKIAEYVSLVLSFAFAFVVTFQTPVIVLLLGWAGIVHPATMVKYRKYAVMACVMIAAVVTPPDAISMLSLAVPMYLLYELGLVLVRVLPAERVSRGFGPKTAPGEHRDGESPEGEDLSARPDDR